MNKKYYWLRLMKNFFTQPKIKKLRRIAGGDTYTIIYLKMQLLSLDNEAVITFQNIEDNIIEEIALTIDEDIDNVGVTFNYLLSQGLIEKIDDDRYLLPETLNLIGSETDVAQRVRKHRENKKTLQCNTDVTLLKHDETNCNTEIYIENREKSIDKNIYGEFKNVYLTDEEYKKLKDKNLLHLIENLSSYIASKNKRYKSHYATILTWARKNGGIKDDIDKGNGKDKYGNTVL